jgi:hypothetical protein
MDRRAGSCGARRDARLHPRGGGGSPRAAGPDALNTRAATQRPPSPDLGGEHAYRQALADGGRVHVDRPLPFLLLARYPEAPFSLARRIAAIGASSVIWPQAGGAAADAGAGAEIARLLGLLQRDYPRFLVVLLHDLPRDASVREESPDLEPFEFELGHGDDAPARAAAEALRSALASLSVDLRTPTFREVPLSGATPGVEAALSGREGVSLLSLGIPQIHRIPGDARRVYPQIYHHLETDVADALLQALAASSTRPRRSRSRSRPAPASARRIARWGGGASSRPPHAPIARWRGSARPSTSCSGCRRSTPSRPSKPSRPASANGRRSSATGRCRSIRTPPSAGSTRSTCARSRTRCSSTCSARSAWNWTSS